MIAGTVRHDTWWLLPIIVPLGTIGCGPGAFYYPTPLQAPMPTQRGDVSLAFLLNDRILVRRRWFGGVSIRAAYVRFTRIDTNGHSLPGLEPLLFEPTYFTRLSFGSFDVETQLTISTAITGIEIDYQAWALRLGLRARL
jgi:hypothetical protein